MRFELRVRGTCVWMAPTGIRRSPLVVQAPPGRDASPAVVIVTGPNGLDQNYGDYRDVGLWFFDNGVKVEGQREP